MIIDHNTPQLPEFDHVMVDIETMGTLSNAAIVSIAAVRFNLDGSMGQEFYRKIKLQTCLKIGLNIEADTLLWWLKQSDAAREELTNQICSYSITTALIELSGFLSQQKEYQIWGNSARFDLGLLENAYTALKMPSPWTHRQERDVRTLVALAPQIKENYQYRGLAHHALYDCYSQIEYCSQTWSFLTEH